jgi:hypothetical protein
MGWDIDRETPEGSVEDRLAGLCGPDSCESCLEAVTFPLNHTRNLVSVDIKARRTHAYGPASSRMASWTEDPGLHGWPL